MGSRAFNLFYPKVPLYVNEQLIAFLEPHNSLIYIFKLHKTCGATDFEAPDHPFHCFKASKYVHRRFRTTASTFEI